MKSIIPKTIQISDIQKTAEITLLGLMPMIQKVSDTFIASHPFWATPIYYVICFYSFYLAYKQEELNEVTEFITAHPSEFRKEIVESDEFRDGFISFFDAYIKERLRKKRKVLLEILLGFTESKDKESFELERLQDVETRISIEGYQHLIFIKREIIPIFEQQVKEEMVKMKCLPTEEKRILDGIWARRSISVTVDKWLYERYNINSEKVKKQYGLSSKLADLDQSLHADVANKEHLVRKSMTDCWPELSSLGIFRFGVDGGTWGGSSSVNYALTPFGFKFMKYISTKE